MKSQRFKITALSTLGAVLCMFGLAGNADAQILRKLFQRSSAQQSNCPGGNCPQSYASPRYSQAFSAPVYAPEIRSAGHWSYPGTISGHLSRTHGVSTAGMTREQMLDLHDALHEGRAVKAVKAVKAAKPVANPVAVPAIKSGTPKLAPQLPAPVVKSSSMFGLGDLSFAEPAAKEQTEATTLVDKSKVDSSDALAATLGTAQSAIIPDHILAQVESPTPEQTARDSFRASLRTAISEARKAGKINMRESVRLRAAMLSPSFVDRAYDLAVIQIAFSGEESEAVSFDENGVVQVNGIDWEGLAKFLEAFVPLLISLLKAFGM